MQIIIHRGTLEIGGICIEIVHGDDRIVIDIGMPLVKPDGKPFGQNEIEGLSAEDLVKRKILPNVPGLYPHDHRRTLGGLFLSHAHMDHFGFYRYLREDIHLYLGEGTRRLIKMSALLSKEKIIDLPYTTLRDRVPILIGSIRVTPYLVDHSAFDSYAFLIEAEGKRVIYTGDFRSHGRKPRALSRFLREAPKEVDALILEGTVIGSDRSGTPEPETGIEEKFIQTIRESKGYVFAFISSQNIDRLVSLYKAAVKTDRLLVVDIYTANILAGLKDLANIPFPSKGFPKVRVYFAARIARKLAEKNIQEYLYRFQPFKITADEIASQQNRVLMVIKSSMIDAMNRLPGINGSTLIYSLWGGYLKEPSMERFVRFIKENRIRMVHHHTSGHADVETLQRVVKELKPITVIPIHTFHPEQYTGLFPNVTFLDDGISHSV